MDESAFVLFWFRAFVVTLVVEVAVLIPALRKDEPSPWRRVGGVGLAQLTSHPLVWFVIPAFGLSRYAYLGVAELWAVLVEAALYRLVFPSLSLKRAALFSLAANATSVLVGLLLRHFGLV